MDCSRVDSDAVTNPDLLRLADLKFGVANHECGLSLELAREPDVVGIEKCDIAASRLARTQITRCGNAFSSRAEKAQTRADFF